MKKMDGIMDDRTEGGDEVDAFGVLQLWKVLW